jgi:protein required for attachment to host cells
MVTWILVTHGSAAKIIEVKKNGEEIRFIKEFSHPQTAKRISHNSPSPTEGGRHAIDYNGEIEKHERHIFAREIADFLTKALRDSKVTDLIVAAPPTMLGEIRQTTEALRKHLSVRELAKDLLTQHLSDKEIVEKIRADLELVHL